MRIILTQNVPNLGSLGDEVAVKDGYARNFLLPQGKALRSTEENRKRFESQRVQLEARNLERKKEADGVAEKLNGQSFIVIRQAGETGQLYGSVTTRDLIEVLGNGGFSVGRNQVELNQPIKTIGLHAVVIALHPEVEAEIAVNVARSEDEAGRQARGEDLTIFAEEADEEEEGAEAAAETEAVAEEAVAEATPDEETAAGS